MKRNNIIIKPFFIFVITISLICFGITLYRATTTGITYDEAYTYMYYVSRNPIKVFVYLFRGGALANNHLLNSFLIAFFNTLFKGNYNEIIIRIPNVLSYVIYFVFAYLITKDNKYKYSSFTMLVLNYGANEFFGLGRGYGLSCALVLGGLYFFKEYLRKNNEMTLTISYAFLLLGCYANTSALIVYASIILVSLFILIKQKRIFKYSFSKIYLLIPIVIATLLVVRYHFMVSADGLPLYGGKGSFYKDVLGSLLNVYGFPIKYATYFINIIILFIIIILTKQSKKLKNEYLIISGILFFILLIIITKVTDSMWLTSRCLIPSMPLIILIVIQSLDLLNVNKKIIFELFIILPLSILFITNLNLKETRDWQDNYIIRATCYEALDTKDNSKVLLLKENVATHFYREKILEESGYDIFEESVKN